MLRVFCNRNYCLFGHLTPPNSFVSRDSNILLSDFSYGRLKINQFHSSAILEGGRRGGNKASEFSSRLPSKKQLKKRSNLMERLAEKRDPQKERMKFAQIKKQVSSKEFQKQVDQIKKSLKPIVEELMAPGAFNDILNGNSTKPEKAYLKDEAYYDEFLVKLKAFRDLKLGLSSGFIDTSEEYINKNKRSKQLMQDSEEFRVNAADSLLQLSFLPSGFKEATPANFQRNFTKAREIYSIMKELKMSINTQIYTNMIRCHTLLMQFPQANEIFDAAISSDVETDVHLWAAKITNVAKSGDTTEAISILDRFQRLILSRDPLLYNGILEALFQKGDIEGAKSFWTRMHTDCVNLNADSFAIVMHGNAFEGEVERAYFHMDEMQSLNIAPTRAVFCALLEASGRAPYWINGYQDSIYDALNRIEAAEFRPGKEIYNSIIKAFAHSGDAVAAEYFFWEMRRKGITQDKYSYIYLLSAYAKAQTIGATTYGWKSRFVKGPEKPLSPEEQDMKEIGAYRTAEIISSGIYSDVQENSKETRMRKKVTLLDVQDTDEGAESTERLIRAEANSIRRLRGEKTIGETKESKLAALKSSNSDASLEWEGIDLKAEFDRDPVIQKLMADFKEAGIVSDNDSEGEEKNKNKNKKKLSTTAANAATTAAGIDSLESEDLEEDSDELSDDDLEEDDFDLDDIDEQEEVEEKEEGDEAYSSHDFVNTESIDEDSLTPYERNKLRSNRVYQKLLSHSFTDPFATEKDIKGASLSSSKQNPDLEVDLKRKKQQVSVASALDTPESKEVVELMRTNDEEWDFFSFGKAPEPNYERSLAFRRKVQTHRAMVLFQSLEKQGIFPDIHLWNKFLSVHSEAVYIEETLKIFKTMKELRLSPTPVTYESLIRMYVRNKEIQKAIELKDTMKGELLTPTDESYGLIIRSLSHRGMIVEALQLLEEASGEGIQIRERNIKILRARCNKLNIQHPNIPPDPLAWVDEVKRVRRNRKLSSNRLRQHIQGLAWN